ncbi:hypothetical protein JZ751_022653 [Albula glossodonta]|uniref:Uncharacterized protein n=1 Tax=Albula glossodonta TaxID=121402 RepID=A0A8T2PDJ0_9TELE|nr:hypothetical protein JZ751_022653 [Albula glossodonta]
MAPQGAVYGLGLGLGLGLGWLWRGKEGDKGKYFDYGAGTGLFREEATVSFDYHFAQFSTPTETEDAAGTAGGPLAEDGLRECR